MATSNNNLTQQLNGLSHHAYCLVGGSSVKTELISMLEKAFKIKTRGNPDFFHYDYETFTIDDARAIKSLAITRPVTDLDGKKMFVLQMNGVTIEAQNALLKLLEEPPEYAHFFLVIPSAHLLLPTVRSRMAVIDVNENAKNGVSSGHGIHDAALLKSVENFVTSSKQGKLDIVKALMDDISKEKRPKQDAVDLINAIQETIHNGGVKKNAKALEAIETARTYMNDRAPSLKMLLEFVAMSI